MTHAYGGAPHVLPADYVLTQADLEGIGWEPGYVEPPPPPAVVDFWAAGLPSFPSFSGGWTPESAAAIQGPAAVPYQTADPYTIQFDDPFGSFMVGTFGALGEKAYGAGKAAGAAGQTLAAGVVPGITGAAGWFEDMSKLAVLGLGAIALIMVAK